MYDERMTQSEGGAKTFFAPTVSLDFSKTCFLLFNFKTSSPPGKKCIEFCKPKRPPVHSSPNTLIVTKVTWHNQPPTRARIALWEVMRALWGQTCHWSSYTLRREAGMWVSTRSHPHFSSKLTMHFSLSSAKWIQVHLYVLPYMSVAHAILLQGSEPLLLLGNRMNRNATRLRAGDWDFTCLLQKYKCSFPE